MTSRIWDWLRMTRANLPVGLAEDPDRSRVYRAALQQFEELIRAASDVGPSSRPLPLFYALSQAGRAIVAARDGPDHRGHGLQLGSPQADPMETLVRPMGGQKLPGQFQAVVQAIESPALAGSVPIGALIASLPELGGVLFMRDEWPVALPVFERLPHLNIRALGWTTIVIVADGIQTWGELERLILAYPTVKDQLGESPAVRDLPSLPRYPTPEGLGLGAMLKGGSEEFDSAAPEYRISGRRWLRPAIAETVAPTPLMTWWVVLYALSMYARYHPSEWVTALDVDSSNSAVTLERTMARALEALPQLVLSELVGQPFLEPDAAGSGADPFSSH